MCASALRPLLLSAALGLAGLPSSAPRLSAQEFVPLDPNPTNHHHRPRPLHRCLGLFHHYQPAIPRTYSYYYDTWFNQPRHYKVQYPDGQVRWRTAVRGLPLGTPWPSH